MWEQAWITLMEQKLMVINFLWIGAVHVVIVILIQNEILNKRHSAKWIALCFAAKILLLDVIFNIGLNSYMEEHWIVYSFFIFLKIFHTILYLFGLWYTYDGGVIKCGLFSIAGELCAIAISGTAIVLFQALGIGMENGYFSIFSWKTVLLAFFCFIIFFSVRRLVRLMCKKQLCRLKECELKYKKFWSCIFGIYVAMTFYQIAAGSLDHKTSTYRLGALTVTMMMLGLVFLGIWIYRKYQNQIRQEHEFLNIKQNLMVLHMKAVRQQILDMENEQRMIDQQMENIQQIGNFEGTMQIKKYLKTLKKQYQKIQAGMYTDDVFVDSVLYYYADMLRRKNLAPEISFARYQRNSLDEICAGKILMCLMETALTNDLKEGQEHKVKLYGGTVKNQVIFRLECGMPERKGRRDKREMKTLKDCVRQYGGSVHISKEENCMKIEVILTGKR